MSRNVAILYLQPYYPHSSDDRLLAVS